MEKTGRKVVLVTGAAGELGRSLVAQLARDGFDCIALDRNRRALEQMHDSLEPAPLIVPLDLAGSGPDVFAELAASLTDTFGRLDGIIHAAADFKSLHPVEHVPADEWMAILQAGLTGPFLLTQALLPLLRGTDDSRIVWVIDDPEQRASAYWGAYGVAQAGITALVRILAAECRTAGPRVSMVDPGPFYSPLRSRAWPAEAPDSLPTADDAAGRVLKAFGV